MLTTQSRRITSDSRPIRTVDSFPASVELGEDLSRLEREEQQAIDRKRQELLALLREIQDKD